MPKKNLTTTQRLDKIDKKQLEMLKILKKIQKEEEQELDDESRLEKEELEELDELKKIESLEKDIDKKLKDNPLKRVTYRDITKGMIGAFFGIVGHFAFAKGVDIAAHYSWVRSTMLLVVAFVIIIIFLYFAGFRRINDKFVFKVLPIRAIVIYVSSIITTVLVLFLYGKIGLGTDFHTIYNTVAAISILAVIGAGTADLIGKNEE